LSQAIVFSFSLEGKNLGFQPTRLAMASEILPANMQKVQKAMIGTQDDKIKDLARDNQRVWPEGTQNYLGRGCETVKIGPLAGGRQRRQARANVSGRWVCQREGETSRATASESNDEELHRFDQERIAG
jgi:hypothetical protein